MYFDKVAILLISNKGQIHFSHETHNYNHAIAKNQAHSG